jgi:hypothetical protein
MLWQIRRLLAAGDRAGIDTEQHSYRWPQQHDDREHAEDRPDRHKHAFQGRGNKTVRVTPVLFQPACSHKQGDSECPTHRNHQQRDSDKKQPEPGGRAVAVVILQFASKHQDANYQVDNRKAADECDETGDDHVADGKPTEVLEVFVHGRRMI